MHKELSKNNRGQSLIEILIGIAVGVIIIGGVTATIGVVLRSNVNTKNSQTAAALAQETLNELTDFAAGNWHNLDGLVAQAQYHLSTTTGVFIATNLPVPAETFTLDGKQFTRYFTYDNVSRDGNGDIKASTAPDNDPSTKKLTVVVAWQEGADTPNVTLNKYVTRSRNQVLRQTDWSGAALQAGPITAPNTRYFGKNNINTIACTATGDANPATNKCMKVQGF